MEKDYARQAARAAFEEVDRIEKELSRFIASSDVSQINRLRAGESVRVGIATFECLQLAKRVHEETNGAFDVTIGALLGGAKDQSARHFGMHLLRINETEHSVGVETEGVMIDLGAIGKGYAVDQIAAILHDWSIEDALIHSGESTVLALSSWEVAMRDPERQEKVLGHVQLHDRALSGSGLLLHGQHIIDARTGRPAEGKRGTWALAPSGAESDALSTAFMVMSTAEVEEYCRAHQDVSAMLVVGAEPGKGGYEVKRFGLWNS
jgi:thiamine biosynthesis lipoprotein